ncbi:MAG: hypothetical protein GVY19_00155 [Bacteroidetes bacterium]|jgi:hypothetical protein|nr:hypothetical protein [Bacteroidota bacterium]
MEQRSLIGEIMGTWLLQSLCQVTHNGERTDIYGTDPAGILMYSSAGYMNAQLGFGKRRIMSSGNIMGGTREEKAEAFDSYMAYFGKYYEREPGTIIHVVEGCTIPNWIGQKEIRYAHINNNLLTITTPETESQGNITHLEVIWERAAI